jgi:ATP-dependent DNA helicase RecG
VGKTPPHRVGHDLTERQRRILHALRGGQRRPLRAIKEAVDHTLPDNTLRNDLVLLRSLGLVESRGRGVGATWNIKS